MLSRVAASWRAVEPMRGPGPLGRGLDCVLAVAMTLIMYTEIADRYDNNVVVRPIDGFPVALRGGHVSPSPGERSADPGT